MPRPIPTTLTVNTHTPKHPNFLRLGKIGLGEGPNHIAGHSLAFRPLSVRTAGRQQGTVMCCLRQ